MDGNRFDDLTRRLVTATSRRKLLRGLAGGAAGGMLALLGRHQTEAFICRQPGATCGVDAHCCSQSCVNYHCACSDNGTLCGRACVDLEFDNNNCGACGNVCPDGDKCFFGTCAAPSTVQAHQEVVWQALMDAQAREAWGLAGHALPAVGSRFQLRPTSRFSFAGTIEGEILTLEPPHRIVFAWQNSGLGESIPVTVELRPTGDGRATQIFVRQESGSSAPCRAAARLLGAAWRQRLLDEGLGGYVASGRR